MKLIGQTVLASELKAGNYVENPPHGWMCVIVARLTRLPGGKSVVKVISLDNFDGQQLEFFNPRARIRVFRERQ